MYANSNSKPFGVALLVITKEKWKWPNCPPKVYGYFKKEPASDFYLAKNESQDFYLSSFKVVFIVCALTA